jgi:hypothetical protein
LQEAFVLSFKLVTGRLGRVKFGPTVEQELRQHLETQKKFFTDRRAVPLLRKKLRTNILEQIRLLIE